MDDDYLADLFSGLGPISVRRMFGGKGIYHQGLIFALDMSDGRIMMKGDAVNAGNYEAAGCERWSYQRPGRNKTFMPYWTAPDDALDSPEAMMPWAQSAFAAALRADDKKRK
ncbi:TfoX/Sxy family protein [Notoacmeibacter sp. MSK16QG-6]|uniref:TfoX/Sxy family protein n=1 Tax=Notoacmeibacter sp. MSK16QG-6 TaxID=2957982 RepID=UPI00209D7870|nr:TfoX/Sxy family protein [Notoacmeibacter sp. MSK16QG-6]MCP1197824.1 TfoX/Sxy family protein [Notoacmeibacter sp. MSK16QG-6]